MVPNTLSRHPLIKGPLLQHPHPAAPPTAIFNTILVERSFLVRLFAVISTLKTLEMHVFAQLDRSEDLFFCIIHKFSVALLAPQVHQDAPLQLVIP